MSLRTRWAFLRGALRERAVVALGGAMRPVRYVGSEAIPAADAVVLEQLGDPGAPAEPTTSSYAHKATQVKRVFRLSDVTVDLINGYVYDDRARLVADTVSWSPAHAFARWPAPPLRPARVEGEALTLGAEAYYHWLIEDVPAYLQARRHAPDAPTVIRDGAPGYVRDLLRILDAPTVGIDVSARFDSLVVASKGAALHPNAIDVAELQRLRAGLEVPSSDVRRFYVSRRDAGRIPANEDEVERLVEAAGYTIVTLTGRGLLDQMALFGGADRIVATHGAGLANLVWCATGGARVTEIATRAQPECFGRLAALCELPYTRVDAAVDGGWVVDLDALGAAIA